MAYNDDEVNVTTLIEGSVNLCHKFDKESAINLKPGDQAKIISVNHKVRVNKVNTADFIAWKDHRFVFRREPLESIFNKLSRWYGAEFKFSDEKVKNIRISADIKRFSELSVILQFIENVAESPITFEVKNNILYVGRIK
jgi:ferric-dicitrate binding protein FerR (iron transport regulator)